MIWLLDLSMLPHQWAKRSSCFFLAYSNQLATSLHINT